MNKTTFVIDRKTWLRGEGLPHSYLLRKDDNKMCCLGQIALQVGCSRNDIRGKRIYRDLPKSAWLKVAYLFPEKRNGMMALNDNKSLTDEEREAQLKELVFPDYNLEFIN